MIHPGSIPHFHRTGLSAEASAKAGFTLIELSIVLVIIGLLVGGIMVGKDMINAAQIRSQISQIGKYNTAVKTFRLKYDALPGDMNADTAASFGFTARGSLEGQGDGNGLLEGNYTGTDNSNVSGVWGPVGETGMFWVDLSKVSLIDGSFNAVTSIGPRADQHGNYGRFFPTAKLEKGNYISVFSEGGVNYFGMSGIAVLWASVIFGGVPAVPVSDAYNIDVKMDDGLPQSGAVRARFNCGGIGWAATPGSCTVSSETPYTTATAGSATSCFDNSATSNGTPGVNGTPQHYSLEINGGSGANCGLGFRFQ
jgi:prepilin-type N-terminal cleavage/methylation domain-containing protein